MFELQSTLNSMRGEIVENAAGLEAGFGQVRGRLTALETRTGKAGAKQERDRYMAELREELKSFNT